MGTIVILWLGAALLIGFIGKSRKIGFDNAVLWSILLSPIIGLIIALSSDKKDSKSDKIIEDDNNDRYTANKEYRGKDHPLKEKYEKMLYGMSISTNSSEDDDMTTDEMAKIKEKIITSSDNYTIISKMIASYYMELNSPKYKNRFKNLIALYTTVGVLDAQIYIFQERSITIKEIKRLAVKSLKEENPLLSFTIEMGVMICKIDAPEIPKKHTEEAWRSLMRKDILQTITYILGNYPLGTDEEITVKNHAEMFMHMPQTISFRKEIGIRES